jgi:MFS family permease
VVQHWGNRQLLQLATLVRVFMPLVALGIQPILGWERLVPRLDDPQRVVLVTFAFVFVAYGVTLSAQMLANFTAVLELAHPEERPTLVGVTNTILGVVALVPMLGGLVVDRFGYSSVFALALALSLLALLASGLLPASRRQPA